MAAIQDADLSLGEVNDRFDVVCGHLNALHGELLDLTCWLLSHDTWKSEGLWTPGQYLAWRAGISPATAKKLVTVAARADELPTCVGMVRRGELSLDQVVPIAKHAPGWVDDQIAVLARHCTVRQITKVASGYRWPDTATHDPDPDPDPGPDPDADAEVGSTTEPDTSVDRCWYGIGDDGRWRLHAETTVEVGMVIAAALDEARDAVFQSGKVDVTGIDALRELAERSLDGVTTSGRRERFRINVHLTTDQTVTDEVGTRLPDVIARHVTCDGLLSPVFWQNGRPLSVGRSQHLVPLRTRREVLRRDGGCRIPGCGTVHHLEIHHITHWTHGGPTDTSNLTALCPHHHRMHHHGRLGITGNADHPDGLTFTDTRGHPITPSGARPRPPGNRPPPQPDGTWNHPIGERLHTRWLHFTPPPPDDLGRAG